MTSSHQHCLCPPGKHQTSQLFSPMSVLQICDGSHHIFLKPFLLQANHCYIPQLFPIWLGFESHIPILCQVPLNVCPTLSDEDTPHAYIVVVSPGIYQYLLVNAKMNKYSDSAKIYFLAFCQGTFNWYLALSIHKGQGTYRPTPNSFPEQRIMYQDLHCLSQSL